MITRILAAWLVRLYPRAWRARFEGELLDWVAERAAERRLGLLAALDLVRGALDAQLHPDLTATRTGAPAGGRRIPMPGPDRQPQRLRGLVLGVLCGYAAFVLAGAGYGKLTEYDDFVAAAHHHAAVGAAFDAILGASLVALAAMLAAGLPIGLAALRQALAGNRELLRPLGVVAAAILWFAGTLMLIAWRARANTPPPGHMDSVAVVSGWIASFVLAITAGVAGAVAAVRRTTLSTRLLRFAAIAAAVTTAAMVVILAATVAWGLILRAADPALFHSAQGIRASSTVASWTVIVTVMAVATTVAGAACAGGLRRRPTHDDPGPAAAAQS